MFDEDTRQFWEVVSYIFTAVAALSIPAGIVTYFLDQKKERLEEEIENHLKRIENYSDLQTQYMRAQQWYVGQINILYIAWKQGVLSEKEYNERTVVTQKTHFEGLVGMFENGSMTLIDETPQSKRYWNSWNDYMDEMVADPAFRESLPELLKGEDAEFADILMRKAGKFENDRRPVDGPVPPGESPLNTMH